MLSELFRFGLGLTAGREPQPKPEEVALALIVHSLAQELIVELRPLVGPIRRHDRALADQLKRAASSTLLNIAEAEYSDPGNGRARLFNAAGSANETLAALEVAEAWGYIDHEQAVRPAELLDRIKALLFQLTRGRR